MHNACLQKLIINRARMLAVMSCCWHRLRVFAFNVPAYQPILLRLILLPRSCMLHMFTILIRGPRRAILAAAACMADSHHGVGFLRIEIRRLHAG
jgi:hypothetical protein